MLTCTIIKQHCSCLSAWFHEHLDLVCNILAENARGDNGGTLEAKKSTFPQLATSTAQSPWEQSCPFFLSLRYAPESEVNLNIQIVDPGLQNTSLKEVESHQQETMLTSVLGQKIKGCSALVGYLAPTVQVQAEGVGRLYEYPWESDTFSTTLGSRLSTSLTRK